MCRRTLQLTRIMKNITLLASILCWVTESYACLNKLAPQSRNNVFSIITSLILVLYLVDTSLVKLCIHIFSLHIRQSFYDICLRILNLNAVRAKYTFRYLQLNEGIHNYLDTCIEFDMRCHILWRILTTSVLSLE